MQDTDVFLKTDAGRDEIKSRARGLSMAMRAILLMVDGQRNVAALRSFIAGSKAPADALEALVAQGLIESRTGAGAVGAPVSIATPRVETMARPSTPIPAPPPPAPPPTPPAPRHDDEPLDLMLPTIYGSDEWSASAASPVPAEAPVRSAKNRYEHLYTMINEVVRDFLPAHRRYLIQLKIERAGTPEELVGLLDAVQAALVKAKGEEFAAGVVARLRSAAA